MIRAQGALPHGQDGAVVFLRLCIVRLGHEGHGKVGAALYGAGMFCTQESLTRGQHLRMNGLGFCGAAEGVQGVRQVGAVREGVEVIWAEGACRFRSQDPKHPFGFREATLGVGGQCECCLVDCGLFLCGCPVEREERGSATDGPLLESSVHRHGQSLEALGFLPTIP